MKFFYPSNLGYTFLFECVESPIIWYVSDAVVVYTC